MDDLSGLQWTSGTASNTPPKAAAPPIMNSQSSFYPPLRPTPPPATSSGRGTPLSMLGPTSLGAKPAAPASKVAADSFSNLVNLGPGKSTANLSLREQQERQEAEKRRKEEERRKQAAAQFGDGAFFDALGQRQQAGSSAGGSRTVSPGILPSSGAGAQRNGKLTESDDDLFAAFNASTKVDNSSYYPPPAAAAPSGKASGKASPNAGLGDDDDDPFGLNDFKAQTGAAQSRAAAYDDIDEDDDLLGDLGKPVDEVRRKQAAAPKFSREPEPGKPIEDSSSDSEVEQADEPRNPRSDDPFDKAVARLVDYGFSPENARRGLTESGAGLNIQAAVNWLLDDAHRKTNEEAKARKNAGGQLRADDTRSSSRSRSEGLARVREDASGDGPSRREDRSPGHAEGDFTKTAAAVSTKFLKTANSLWKTGQKRMQQVVADFQQQEADPSQPKWMAAQARQDSGGAEKKEQRQRNVTDEAMMLESDARPGRRQTKTPQEDWPSPTEDQSPARRGPTSAKGNATPKWQPADARARLSKQAIEEESSQAYVSPARRKKATSRPQPQPEAVPAPAEEPDLLFNTAELPASRPSLPSRPTQPSPLARQTPSPRPPPPPPPPPAVQRQIPSVSAAALQTSTQHRLAGTAHFKRGDYAAAHATYSASLAALPPTHPLTALLLCNRALTALKTGEPRQAVEDADAALRVIGPGKGEGEFVELQGGDADRRDMHELYGKALTRKAEALEQMEKWGEAGAVWQACVEAGVGGPAAIAGRQRCQKALAPKPPTPAPRPPRPAVTSRRPQPTASAAPSKNSGAVERLRAANEAAEREGDEKFALADRVEARIAAWRDGKRENLRALLGSLDAVLWEGSGWKKVGMHELVMAGKVKVIYMRAIAKTHPDKIAQDASTEVRMIAATVFSTLNEAWDKFKAENGL